MIKSKAKKIHNDNKILLKIIGQHLRRYNVLLMLLFGAIILLDIIFTLGWYFSPDNVSLTAEIAFYIAQGILFIVSSLMIVFLVLIRKGKYSDYFLGLINHIYAGFLIAWATTVFCLDLSLGFSPLTFLIVATFVSGVFIISPFYFAILELLSLIPIIITISLNSHIFFGGEYLAENITLFISFVVLIAIISFRNYRVIHTNFKIEKKLEALSYRDELTGLLNERSYVNETESIDRRINEGEDVKFAVILMDVNNLKATNDAYGHRYGCSLVVRCGHLLPKLLPSSKLFHVGGDEFIAIVEGDDYNNFEEVIKKFDEATQYSIYDYEGQKLIFSVARGYHVRKENEHYKDVLQIADKEMYENKKHLKEKYNMKGR